MSHRTFILAAVLLAGGCCRVPDAPAGDGGSAPTASGAAPSRSSAGQQGEPGSVFSCWDEKPNPETCREYRGLPREVERQFRAECRGDEDVVVNGPCPRAGTLGVCKSAVDTEDRLFEWEAAYTSDEAASLKHLCTDSLGGTFTARWP
jgi:hypothetical protein